MNAKANKIGRKVAKEKRWQDTPPVTRTFSLRAGLYERFRENIERFNDEHEDEKTSMSAVLNCLIEGWLEEVEK